MEDFIHWDDSDLDLDRLLGDYTDYENDLNFDEWSDENNCTEEITNSEKRAKVDKENRITLYNCPLCRKAYKTISGFRGHVTKKHNRTDLKAKDHRISDDKPHMTKETNLPLKDSISSVPKWSNEEMRTTLDNIMEKAIQLIRNDPLNKASCSVKGPKLINIACDLVNDKGVQTEILEMMTPKLVKVFTGFGQGCTMASDREGLWSRYHKLRTDQEFVCDLISCIEVVTSESMDMIRLFVQSLLDRIVDNIFKQLAIVMEKKQEEKSKEISDNDQSVLFYIAGYVAFKAKKCKIGGSENLCEKFTRDGAKKDQQEFVKKFGKWTDKVNRGGLQIPSDDFFLLIRSMENIVRGLVDITKLNTSSLLTDNLREELLSNFMIQFYWDKLVTAEDESKLKLLDFVISIFLRMRGGAVTKYVKRQCQKEKKEEKKKTAKSGHSLRMALKTKN